MRFIHTGDWQMGMSAAHAGEAAKAVRQARLDSASRVLELARRHEAEFILLAGDTFESNGVSRELVRSVARILTQTPCPVFLIAGNHDPLRPGSVWEDGCWLSTPKVSILRDQQPVPIDGGTLYPCSLTSKRSDEDPTGWIPNENRAGIRIGVAHGSACEFGEDGGFPIPFNAASRSGLDYLALGHWHSSLVFPDGRMAYSGTHETTRFGEKDSGNVLVVEIAAPGALPEITKVRSGSLEWLQVEEMISAPDRLAEITRAIASAARRDRLVDVKLSGLLFERETGELDRIHEVFRSYLYGRLDDSQLRPAPNDNGWIDSLPPGLIQHAAARLRDLAVEANGAGAIAVQALRELYTLQSEARP